MIDTEMPRIINLPPCLHRPIHDPFQYPCLSATSILSVLEVLPIVNVSRTQCPSMTLAIGNSVPRDLQLIVLVPRIALVLYTPISTRLLLDPVQSHHAFTDNWRLDSQHFRIRLRLRTRL